MSAIARMTSHASKRTGISYAARKQGLREQMPESLRRAGSTRRPFDDARDPWLRKQREAERKTETQRRETGDGSEMIKLHKPFPELRPKHERAPIRESFNRAWLREENAARMKQYDTQARQIHREAKHDLHHQHARSGLKPPSRER